MVLFMLAFMPVGHAEDIPKPQCQNTQKTEPASYLFVQSALKADLEIDKTEVDTYTLTLHDVNPYVTYFADRPRRNAGVMPVEQFIKLWDVKGGENSFKKVAPNADLNAMVGLSSSNTTVNYAIEIKKVNYDSHSKKLVYTVKSLKGNINPMPKSTTQLHHVTLFIDNACIGCFGT